MRRIISTALASACFFIYASLSTAAQALEIHEVAKGQLPAIAADLKGTLHVVFTRYDYRALISQIFYSQSENGGIDWTSPIEVGRLKIIVHRFALAWQ